MPARLLAPRLLGPAVASAVLSTLVSAVAWTASGCATRPPSAPTIPSRTVSVEVQTPTPAWSIEIVEARLVDGALMVLSELSQQEGPAAQVISSARDTADVTAPPDAPVTHFILGKTWQWGEPGPSVRFIESREALGESFRQGLRVYP